MPRLYDLMKPVLAVAFLVLAAAGSLIFVVMAMPRLLARSHTETHPVGPLPALPSPHIANRRRKWRRTPTTVWATPRSLFSTSSSSLTTSSSSSLSSQSASSLSSSGSWPSLIEAGEPLCVSLAEVYTRSKRRDEVSILLGQLGGKASNLARLLCEGFPVPPAVCLTTTAFRWFLRPLDEQLSSNLEENENLALVQEFDRLLDAMQAIDPTKPAAATSLAQQAQAVLARFPFPSGVATAVEEELSRAFSDDVSTRFFAVRSSGTAEDLPGAAFAGQHDSFLNVQGLPAVYQAVQRCWASLYSERAILYRARQGMGHRDVEIAVIVQAMVQPSAAGVLFTADPITGNRQLLTIDAVRGLGEALVSGLVCCDNYRVHKPSRRLEHCQLGSERSGEPSNSSGTNDKGIQKSEQERVLDLQQVSDLCALGIEIEKRFEAPQDVEWAICSTTGTVHVVQARPITTLYPLPNEQAAGETNGAETSSHDLSSGRLPDPDESSGDEEGLEQLYVSFGHVQMMTDPISPMGRDVWKLLVSCISRGGLPPLQASEPLQVSMLVEAGSRLFVNPTPLLRVGWLRSRVLSALRRIYPTIPDIIDAYLSRGGGGGEGGRGAALSLLSVSTLRWASRALFAVLDIVHRSVPALLWRSPDAARRQIVEAMESLPAGFDRALHACQADSAERIAATVHYLQGVFPRLAPVSYPNVGAAIVSERLLQLLLRNRSGCQERIAALYKHLPYNVTSQMDKRILSLAELLWRSEGQAVCELPTDELLSSLLRRYHNESASDAFSAGLRSFLDEFGCRCTAEIDVGRPRWREDPSLVLATVIGSLAAGDRSPTERHRQLEESEDPIAAFDSYARSQFAWPWRGLLTWLAGRLARNVRYGMSLREHPKFGVIRLIDRIRTLMREDIGSRWQQQGILDDADDIFYLHLNEAYQLALSLDGEPFRKIIASRKAAMQVDARRKPPLVMTSAGEVLTAPPPRDVPHNTLVGVPASAGVVEATVTVILRPEAEVLPVGHILVAPHTDPCWTPLFLNAAGIITEVGGLLTHGSVTAREYGLPAVVSVADATTKLRTGDLVRLDGRFGTVTLLSRNLQ